MELFRDNVKRFLAEGILAIRIEYVNGRQTFGGPISSFKNARFKLSEMATDLRINRSFVNECESLFLADELDVTAVSMAKLVTTEMPGRVTDASLQLHDDYGYMKAYAISRSYVDTRVTRICVGISEIIKELIGRIVLKRQPEKSYKYCLACCKFHCSSLPLAANEVLARIKQEPVEPC